MTSGTVGCVGDLVAAGALIVVATICAAFLRMVWQVWR